MQDMAAISLELIMKMDKLYEEISHLNRDKSRKNTECNTRGTRKTGLPVPRDAQKNKLAVRY